MTLEFPEIVANLQARQRKMKQEQDGLLSKNEESFSKAQDISGAEVKRKYSEVVLQDKINIQGFNKAIESHQNVVEGEFPITTNKMELILQGIDPLNEDGEIIKKYDNSISASCELPILGNREFWGSSLPTFYSATLLYRLRAITGETFTEIMPMHSSIFHIAPFSQTLLSLLGNDLLTDKNYIFTSYDKVDLGFGFIHSGFAFGGSRNQKEFYSKYLFDKELDGENIKYFPEDCSSWIAGICKQTYSSSTADLLCAHRVLSKSTDHVPDGWKSQPMAEELLTKFIPIDPLLERLQPGDLYVVRSFSESCLPESSLGTKLGHHVGLIFSPTIEKNQLESIEFTRAMPTVEGFGRRKVLLDELVSGSDAPEVKKDFKKIYYLRPQV